jgi:hypothetical protein
MLTAYSSTRASHKVKSTLDRSVPYGTFLRPAATTNMANAHDDSQLRPFGRKLASAALKMRSDRDREDIGNHRVSDLLVHQLVIQWKAGVAPTAPPDTVKRKNIHVSFDYQDASPSAQR